MAKKIWGVISVLTVLAAGFFLYNGGKLLFWYHDRRQGILILASGLAMCVLYAWSFHQSFRKAEDGEAAALEVWERNEREFVLSNVAVCFGMAGITLYHVRYGGAAALLFYPGGIFLFMILCTCMTLFIKGEKGKLPEKDFQKLILDSASGWEEKGYAQKDYISGVVLAGMIEEKVNKMKGSSLIFIVVYTVMVNAALAGSFIYWLLSFAFLAAVLIILVILRLYSRGSRKLLSILNEGKSKSVLGFFVRYYEAAESKTAGLSPTVQCYAIAALCDQGAYEEALELLETIKRLPQMEEQCTQYEMIALEGVRRRTDMEKDI